MDHLIADANEYRTEVTINSPGNGQTVSGKTVVAGVTLGPDIYWDQLQVDGSSVLSGSGNLTWDTTTVANGTHKLMVRAFQQGGTTPIGTAFISVVVNNLNATPTPAPPTPSHTPAPSSTPTPTPPTPSPTPTYLSTLSATASLPNETQCANMIPVTTETVRPIRRSTRRCRPQRSCPHTPPTVTPPLSRMTTLNISAWTDSTRVRPI